MLVADKPVAWMHICKHDTDCDAEPGAVISAKSKEIWMALGPSGAKWVKHYTIPLIRADGLRALLVKQYDCDHRGSEGCPLEAELRAALAKVNPMLVADKCDHCGATGWRMYHDFKTCGECQSSTCKDCASDWQDDTNSTVCKVCAAETA